LEPKSAGQDLRSLREKYVAILEEQVVAPLKDELAARQQQLQGRAASLQTDVADYDLVRQGVDTEARKVRSALSLLDDGLARVRSMNLRELQAFAGSSSVGE
jgi:hypothetical protein